MKDQLVPIDHAGRMVLPKSIRDELSIKGGDFLKITVLGTSVSLTPNNEHPPGFQRKGKAFVFTSGKAGTFDHETVASILNEIGEEGMVLGMGRAYPKKLKS